MAKNGCPKEEKIYILSIDIEMDIVAKFLEETSKPKKARRISRIIVDPNKNQRFLEIVDPVANKYEHEMMEQDLNVSRINIGPKNS